MLLSQSDFLQSTSHTKNTSELFFPFKRFTLVGQIYPQEHTVTKNSVHKNRPRTIAPMRCKHWADMYNTILSPMHMADWQPLPSLFVSISSSTAFPALHSRRPLLFELSLSRKCSKLSLLGGIWFGMFAFLSQTCVPEENDSQSRLRHISRQLWAISLIVGVIGWCQERVHSVGLETRTLAFWPFCLVV